MSLQAMRNAVEALDKHDYETADHILCQAIAEAEKQDKFCDNNCVWTDHHKDCVRASVSWKDMAFARLGAVRDKMRPDDVETVQRFLDGDCTHLQPKREPLTDEQIDQLVVSELGLEADADTMHDFARAIEAAHGIKEKNT